MISINDMDTTKYVLERHLGTLGIDLPEFPEPDLITAGETTREEITQALRESTHDNPYLDPEAQKLFIAHQMFQANFNAAAHQQNEADKRAAYVNARPGLIKKIVAAFDTAATDLEAETPTISHFTDLNNLQIQNDPPKVVKAAMTARNAITRMTAALNATATLNQLTTGTVHSSGAPVFSWANPSAEDIERIESFGGQTIWNTARAGVEFTMAQTPAESQQRRDDHRRAVAAKRDDARAHRNSGSGAVWLNPANL